MSPVITVSILALSLAGCSKDEAPASVEPGVGGGVSAGVGAGAGAGVGVGGGTFDDAGEFPLKTWMKANMAAGVNHGDFGGLTVALEKLATWAPPGYPFWASIARDGADAARSQDIDAVRGACRGCHSQYRDQYKRELRGRPIGT
jgi:hypothetical protein